MTQLSQRLVRFMIVVTTEARDSLRAAIRRHGEDGAIVASRALVFYDAVTRRCAMTGDTHTTRIDLGSRAGKYEVTVRRLK